MNKPPLRAKAKNGARSLAFAIVIASLLLLDGQRLTRLHASGAGRWNPVTREVPALARAAVTYFIVRIRINAVTALGLLTLMLVLEVDDPILWAAAAFFALLSMPITVLVVLVLRDREETRWLADLLAHD